MRFSTWKKIFLSFSLFFSSIVIDSISIECFISSSLPSKSRFLHQFNVQFFVRCASLSLVDPELFHAELFVPGQTFLLDFYELQLTVTRNVSSMVSTTTKSIFVQITPSGITANLVLFGTSMITSGANQDLQLNPGKHSLDLDAKKCNASVNPRLPSSDVSMMFHLGLELSLLLSNLFADECFSHISSVREFFLLFE
jgi:hypothetical protein